MTDLQRHGDMLEQKLRAQRLEAQHHVRNLLAVTRALVKRTWGAAQDGDTAFALLDGRLAAFGRVQSVLLRREDNCVELSALVADELLAHGARTDRLTHPEKPLLVPSKPAVLLNLIFHELLCLARIDEPIRIDWKDSGGSFEICWQLVAHDHQSETDRDFLLEIMSQAVPYEISGEADLSICDGDIVARLRMPSKALESKA